jgi:hypothetical protein
LHFKLTDSPTVESTEEEEDDDDEGAEIGKLTYDS